MNATVIGWLITIFFVLVLVAGFLIGFWRGLKRSTVNLVISIVGVVVAFFVTPVITNALLGINITMDGETFPLREFAVQLFEQDPDLSLMMLTNPNIRTLALGLPGAVLNAVLFVVVTSLVEGILYIIYKILACTVFKYRLGQNKHRVWGGAIGLVKTFVIALIAMMPFASLIGLASSMVGTPATDKVADAAEEQVVQTGDTLLSSRIPVEAVEVINGLENNFLVKCCGVFGMDDAMFDYYATVEIDKEQVVIREEVSNIYQTANSVYQVSSLISKGGSIATLDYEGLSNVVNQIVDSGLFKTVVAETLGDILVNHDRYDFISTIGFFQENPEVLDDIASDLVATRESTGSYQEYFANDIKGIFNVFRTLGERGLIDGIVQLQEPTAENIVAFLTNDDNIENFTSCVLNIVDINLVRAAAGPATQELLEMIITDSDEIDVNTSAWTDADWNGVARKIVETAQAFGDLAGEISFESVLENPMVLLDKQENYDIASITANIGKLIDSIRENALFKKSDGSSVIDSYLEDFDLTLPTAMVKEKDSAGNVNPVEITSYSKLFDFVDSALVTLRDSGLYDTLTTSDDVLGDLAETLEQDNQLLNKIILPLIQVEPTKTIINDVLETSFDSNFIDLSVLSSYEEWDSDLTAVANILTTLDGKSATIKEGSPAEDKEYTYLELITNNKMDALIDVIAETEVEEIFKPILHAKSTAPIKTTIVEKINASIADMTGQSVATPSSAFTFELNNAEDQTTELCTTLQFLVLAKRSYIDGQIKNINKNHLGTALEVMKYNAYRTSLTQVPIISLDTSTGLFAVTYVELGAAHSEEGVFVNAFDALMNKMQTEYATEIAALAYFDMVYPSAPAADKAKAAEYKTKLSNEAYSEINFIDMMSFFTTYAA